MKMWLQLTRHDSDILQGLTGANLSWFFPLGETETIMAIIQLVVSLITATK